MITVFSQFESFWFPDSFASFIPISSISMIMNQDKKAGCTAELSRAIVQE